MNPPRPLEGTNNRAVLKSFVQLFWRTSSLLLEDFKWNVMAKPTRWLTAWEIDVCLAEEGVLVRCSPLMPDHKEKAFTPPHPPLSNLFLLLGITSPEPAHSPQTLLPFHLSGLLQQAQCTPGGLKPNSKQRFVVFGAFFPADFGLSLEILIQNNTLV